MKYLGILFAALCLLNSCNTPDSTSTYSETIDPITIDFVTQKLCNTVSDSNKLILLINPSFCGSCTNSIRQFAQKIMQLPCHKCLVLSSPDSLLQQAVQTTSNTSLTFVSADTLERFNLLNPYSKLFDIRQNTIFNTYRLIEEKLPLVWKELEESKVCVDF